MERLMSATLKIRGGNVPLILAIHEADGQDVTIQEDVAYSLVTGGGKPGQGYPCVLICSKEQSEDGTD